MNQSTRYKKKIDHTRSVIFILPNKNCPIWSENLVLTCMPRRDTSFYTPREGCYYFLVANMQLVMLIQRERQLR